MDRIRPISEAAQALGVSVTTLRRWEKEGKITPDRTYAGHRRYDLSKIKPEIFHADPSSRKTIALQEFLAMTRRQTWNGRSKS